MVATLANLATMVLNLRFVWVLESGEVKRSTFCFGVEFLISFVRCFIYVDDYSLDTSRCMAIFFFHFFFGVANLITCTGLMTMGVLARSFIVRDSLLSVYL